MTNQPLGRYTVRSGLSIYPVQQEAMEQTLTELIQRMPAHFLLLADVTGQVILTRGEQTQIEPVALASLIAGDLAASQEIARLTGQYQNYQMVLREGKKINSFIIEAGHHLALFVQVANDVPLGWARMLIKQVAQQLTDIAATPPETEVNEPFDLGLEKEELPGLFSDALYDLWKE